MNQLEEFLKDLLEETRQEVGYADAKASILLGGTGVAGGAVIAGMIAGDVQLARLDNAIEWMAWLSGLFALVAVVLLGLAVYPRLGEPSAERARYFGDIVEASRAGVDLKELVEHERSDVAQRYLDQLVGLSEIVWKKHLIVRWAVRLILGSGLLSVTCFVADTV